MSNDPFSYLSGHLCDILLGKGQEVNTSMVGCRAVVGYSESVSVVSVGKELWLYCIHYLQAV